MISFSCSGCHTDLEVPDSQSGSKVNCPECGKALLVPVGSKSRGQPEKPTSSRRKPPPQRTEKAEPERPRQPKQDAAEDDRPHRKKAKKLSILPVIVIGAIAAVSVAAGGAWWYLHSGSSPVQTSEAHPPASAPATSVPPVGVAAPGGAAPKKSEETAQIQKPAAAGANDLVPASNVSSLEIYQHILKSTAVIISQSPNNEKSRSSGTLIDGRNRWVLTNYRAPDQAGQIFLLFPKLKNGALITDSEAYKDLKDSDLVGGKVLMSDSKRDLTLLQIDRVPEGILPAPVAQHSVRAGDRVHFIANPTPSAALWVYSSAIVRALAQKKWSTGLDRAKQDFEILAVETQPPPMQGDSGGPVVNDKGELAGIALGGAQNNAEPNTCVDVTEVLELIRNSSDSLKVTWARETRPVAPLGQAIDVANLIRRLDDPSDAVRAHAAEDIGKLRNEGRIAIPDLVKHLTPDSGDMTRRFAQAALDKIGAPDKADLGFLKDSLRNPAPVVRAYAALGLARLGPDARPAVPALIEAARDRDTSVRAAAVRALGKMGPSSRDAVFPALTAALKDSEDEVHGAAAEGIASMGSLGAGELPFLRELLKDKNPEARAFALRSVGQLGRAGQSAIPDMVEGVKASDKNIRRAALGALVAQNAEAKTALPLYLQAMDDSDSEVRKSACLGLAAVGLDAKASVPALQKRLSDVDRDVRLTAALALAKFGPTAKEAASALVALAKENDKDLRLAALAAIAEVGPGAVNTVEDLIGLFGENSDDQESNRSIVQTLAKIGKGGVPVLIRGLRSENRAIRLGSVRALGTIGPPARSTKGLLLQLARFDREAEIKQAAQHALEQVTAKP